MASFHLSLAFAKKTKTLLKQDLSPLTVSTMLSIISQSNVRINCYFQVLADPVLNVTTSQDEGDDATKGVGLTWKVVRTLIWQIAQVRYFCIIFVLKWWGQARLI